MELSRDRIVRRVAEAAPRLVILRAPAGFGKTVLARQLARSYPSHARIDAAVDRGTTEFETLFAAVSAHLADAGALLVVDNVDGAKATTVSRLARLLASTAPSTTIALCSRRATEFPASKVAAPHRILTLRWRDIAFDRAEIGRCMPPGSVSDASLGLVERATLGWPVAVLLMRRLAAEGSLDGVLARLDDAALGDVHAYLADEMLGALSANERSVVLTCAAIEKASADDVASALGMASIDGALGRVLEAMPFVERSDDGAYVVHPLLRAAVVRRYPHRCTKLATAAAAGLERRQRYVRAAQIYGQLGQRDAMARAICADNARPNRRQSQDCSSLVASLDTETLTKHTVLRGLTTYAKRFRVDPHRLRDETEAVWNDLPQDTPFETRCNIGGPLARIMYETGRFESAERLLRGLEREVGGIPDVPRTSGEAYVARTLACVLARSGRLSEADGYFRRGYFVLAGAEMVESRYAIERAIIERLHGRRNEERRFADRAIELAVEQNASVHIACALGEAAFGAWLAGEDERCNAYVDRLAERADADGMRGFAHFCAAHSPARSVEPNGTEQPNWLACAHVIAAAATEGAARVAHAEAAKDAADQSNDLFLRVIADVTLAQSAPERRNDQLLDALIVAGRIDAPGPQQAVAALLADERDLGLLGALVGRLRRAQPAAAEPMRIEILTRSVRRAGTRIELRERELALLVALARQRRAYTRSEIVDALWADLDETSARDALNTCLYRVRRRLGEDVVLWSRDEGYRLQEHVRVDLRELEQWIGALRRDELQRHEHAILRGAYARLRDAHLEASERWEWLEPVVARVRHLRLQAADLLGRDALRRIDHAEALRIARELLDADPCDEAACELAIRAHLGFGDRTAAAREFRQYRDVLRRQMDAEPSAELAHLAFGGRTATAPQHLRTVA